MRAVVFSKNECLEIDLLVSSSVCGNLKITIRMIKACHLVKFLSCIFLSARLVVSAVLGQPHSNSAQQNFFIGWKLYSCEVRMN